MLHGGWLAELTDLLRGLIADNLKDISKRQLYYVHCTLNRYTIYPPFL